MEGIELDEHVPKFIYAPISCQDLSIDLLKPEALLIDLGEAFLLDEGRGRGFFMNPSYAAPELLFIDGEPTKKADIWALATVFYELKSAVQLFDEMHSLGEIQEEILRITGPLPKEWVAKIAAKRPEDETIKGQQADNRRSHISQKLLDQRHNYASKARRARYTLGNFFEQCANRFLHPKSGAARSGESLSDEISKIGKWEKWCYMTIDEQMQGLKDFNEKYADGEEPDEVTREECNTGAPPPGPLSVEEAADFEDLLGKMLKLEPSKRISLEEVLDHAWLQKSYEDEVGDKPWIEPYFSGRTYEVMWHGKRVTFP